MKNLIGSLKSVSLTVLCFAALLSYMSTTALQIKGEQQTALSWGEAGWVSASNEQPVSYFVGHLVLSHQPSKAILQIAATDSYDVYINGTKIVHKNAPSVNPLWVGAVEKALKPGVNAIGIRVEKKVWGGEPRLLLSLGVEDFNGLKRTLVTNENWKVSNIPVNAFRKTVHWAHPSFDSSVWQRARVLVGESTPQYGDSLISGIDGWGNLDGFRPVWHAHPGQEQAHLSVTTPFLRSELYNAWLMIRCEGNYKVSINGRRTGDYIGDTDQVKLINVYQYLSAKKENTLEVFADCENRKGISLQFMAKKSAGGTLTIPGIEWLVARPGIDMSKQPEAQHPYYLVLPEMESRSGRPASRLIFDRDSVDVVDEINYVLVIVRWLQGMLLWVSLVVVSVSIVFNLSKDNPMASQSVNITLALGSMLVGLFCMMALDIRVAAEFVFNFYVIAFIVLMLFLLEIILVVQLRASRDAHFPAENGAPLRPGSGMGSNSTEENA